MDIHRLHVIKFDSRISEESNANGKFNKRETNTIHDTVYNKNEVNKQKQTVGQRSECTNVITKLQSSKHIRSFIKHKSKSEVLRVTSKRKKLKKHIRKALSLNEVKRDISLRNNVCSAWSKQAIRKRRIRREGTRKKQNKREDFVVLFANDKLTLTGRPRNRSPKICYQNVGETNSSYDVFGFKKCNRSIFPNIQNHHRSDTNISETQTDKLKKKKKERKKQSKTQTFWTCIRSRNHHNPLKLLSSRKLRRSISGVSFCRCLMPKHYNLVDFPDCSKTKIGASNTVRLYQIDSWTNESGDFGCPCKDEQVSVTPSRLQVPTTSFGDAAVATIQCDFDKPGRPTSTSKLKATKKLQISQCDCDKVALPTSTSKIKATKKSQISQCGCDKPGHCTSKLKIKDRESRTSSKRLQTTSSTKRSKSKIMFPPEILSRIMLCPTAFSKRDQTPGKTVVKYILLGIIIAVWSPCLIAIGICWLITYPLRPHHTVINDKERKFQQNNSHHKDMDPCDCDTGKRKCFSKLIDWSTRLLNKAVYSGKAIKSLIKSSEDSLHSSHAAMPCSPGHTIRHPDPNKRYNLFYANNRGWLMKPIHNRSKSKRNNGFVHKIYSLLCGSQGPKINTVNCFNASANKTVKQKSSLKENKACPCLSRSVDKRVTIEEPRAKSEKKKKKDNLSHKSSAKISQQKLCSSCAPCSSLYQNDPQKFPKSGRNTPPSQPTFHRRVQPSKHFVTPPKPTSADLLQVPRVSSKSLRRAQFPSQTQTPTPARQCLEDCDGYRAQRSIKAVQKSPKRFRTAPNKQHLVRVQNNRKKIDSRNIGFMKFRANNKNHKKPKTSFGQKIYCRCKATYRRAKKVINKADADVWSDDIQCHDMYVHTLKRKPWFWVHRCCPSMYPCFLTWHKCSQNTCRMLVYLLSVCVWCPIICWCYLVYELFCQCMK